MTPRISYMVCSTPRTGSTLLCAGLQKTGICGHPEEYFNYSAPFNIPHSSQGPRAFNDYLDEALEKGTSPNGVFGFKIHQMDFPHLAARLQEIDRFKGRPLQDILNTAFPQLRCIYMRRRDTARQAISLEKAFQSNVWEIAQGQVRSDSVREPMFRYNYFSLYITQRELAREDALWGDYFKAHSIEPLEIFYEDMVRQYGQTLEKVLSFLQIDHSRPVAISLPYQKLSDEVNDRWCRRYARTPAWVGRVLVKWKKFKRNASGRWNYWKKKLRLPEKRRLLFFALSHEAPEADRQSRLGLLKSLRKSGWEVEMICPSREGDFRMRRDTSLGIVRWTGKMPVARMRLFIKGRLRQYSPHAVLAGMGRTLTREESEILREAAQRGYPALTMDAAQAICLERSPGAS